MIRKSYITRVGMSGSQQWGIASHCHERLYTSGADVDERRDWMTKRRKRKND